MTALLALLLAIVPAEAGKVAVTAAGGMDFPTDQLWTGVDVAYHPDLSPAWSPVARLTPAWAFGDDRPILFLDAGITAVIPRDFATKVRVGLVGKGIFMVAPYRVPWGFENCDGDRFSGVVPGVEALVEFEYGDTSPFIFGVRGGIGSAATSYLCDSLSDVSDCNSWYPAFIGGFYARGQIGEFLYLEGIVGPSMRLGAGVAF